VREKELGSIVNFYVTPVTRLEFLIGKQIPYVALALSTSSADGVHDLRLRRAVHRSLPPSPPARSST